MTPSRIEPATFWLVAQCLNHLRHCVSVYTRIYTQSGARKTGPPSRRPKWAYVSDSVQEIKQMQMQSTYWLEKMLKMISLYVNALLCTLQHIVIQAMQLSGVNSEN